MFGQMMSSIDDDYVKIVMHAQVQVLQQAPIDQGALAGAEYQAAEDPVQGTSGIERALAAGPAPGEEVVFAPDPTSNDNSRSPAAVDRVEESPRQRPMVLDSAFDRVGRNDPCPCGSGKKFKFCHGR
jgi:preprotein translocase subunit SecA